VLTVASSGITTLLISGGRTKHSRFGIPIIVDEISTCVIHPKIPMAQLISKAKLIIWDEEPMMHKHCFEALDHNLWIFLLVVKLYETNFTWCLTVISDKFFQ